LFANDLIKASELNVEAMFGTMEAFSLAATSYALDNNLTWPFVTVPDWELRTNQARHSTGLESIALTPLVYEPQLKEWEAYSQQNIDWLDQGLRIQGRYPSSNGPQVSPEVYRLNVEGEPPNFYMPVFEIGPAPDILSIINMDTLAYTTFQRSFDDSLDLRKPLLSEITSVSEFFERAYTWYEGDLSAEYDIAQRTESRKLIFENATTGEEYVPHSYIMQPVFESFEKDAKVVAMLIGIIPWHTYFRNLLPDGVKGFVVDVKDSCGSEITYRIDGENATLMGAGDLHDPNYDYLNVSRSFAEFSGIANAEDYKLLNEEEDHHHSHCFYTLNVYPSSELENTYISNKPAIYSSVVVLVFFFTAMVFIMYDYLVTRRQTVVLSAAARTQALVSSLFPKSVQQRMLEDANEHALNELNINRTYGFRAKSQLKEFLEDDGDHNSTNMQIFSTRPIADLFPVSAKHFIE
jgi:hypothetical protein